MNTLLPYRNICDRTQKLKEGEEVTMSKMRKEPPNILILEGPEIKNIKIDTNHIIINMKNGARFEGILQDDRDQTKINDEPYPKFSRHQIQMSYFPPI